jgi:Holliday junction resolvasome RuvABC endonuclease subunit
MGWALVEKNNDGYKLLASGIKGLTRNQDESFSDYRRRLISFWYMEYIHLLVALEKEYTNDRAIRYIASERLPAASGSNFVVATQAELAKTVITVCQTMAEVTMLSEWEELAANTIKKNLTGNHKATKVNIRNTVCDIFPELKPRKKELIADETDAIAIGLVALGFKKETPKQHGRRSKSKPPGTRDTSELSNI